MTLLRLWAQSKLSHREVLRETAMFPARWHLLQPSHKNMHHHPVQPSDSGSSAGALICVSDSYKLAKKSQDRVFPETRRKLERSSGKAVDCVLDLNN